MVQLVSIPLFAKKGAEKSLMEMMSVIFWPGITSKCLHPVGVAGVLNELPLSMLAMLRSLTPTRFNQLSYSLRNMC